jgi:hypothetical protein
MDNPDGQRRMHLLSSPLAALDPWCSGPTCQPVTLEIAGSNPVGSAIFAFSLRPVRPPERGVFRAQDMLGSRTWAPAMAQSAM